LSIYIDGQLTETEVHKDNLYKNITGGGNDNIVIGQRFRDVGFSQGLVDDFHVFDRKLTAGEIAQLYDGQSLTKTLSTPIDKLSEKDHELLREYYFASINKSHNMQLSKLRSSREKLKKLLDEKTEIMVMEEMTVKPRSTFVLNRGVYNQPNEKVTPKTPSILPDFPKNAPQNRLGLAQWLTSTDNPLTSRVAVNHFWQICFGNGLVRTPEDFGIQGKRPSHPALLDWLASDFMENDWNVKRLLKQIVMSATYQQSSITRPSLEVSDPENNLLARAPRYRLTAEMIRDNALNTSGLISTRMGGGGSKPYDLTESFKPMGHDKGEGLYRRSVYTFWKRTGPAPVMMALDASKRDVCRAKRETTATPLQALVLMNGPQFVEAARKIGESMVREHGDNIHSIINDMFRKLTSRKPSEREIVLMKKLYNEQLANFKKDIKATDAFLGVGASPNAKNLDKPQVAAAGVLAKALMNFDEAVIKR